MSIGQGCVIDLAAAAGKLNDHDNREVIEYPYYEVTKSNPSNTKSSQNMRCAIWACMAFC